MASPLRLLALTLLLMAVKGSVLFLLGASSGSGAATAGCSPSAWPRRMVAFVLGGFMLQRNIVPEAIGQQLFLVVALSMLLTPLFFMLYELLVRRIRSDAPAAPDADQIEEQGPIIIAGIGRFGQVVNRMIQMAGFRATVLDQDLATVG